MATTSGGWRWLSTQPAPAKATAQKLTPHHPTARRKPWSAISAMDTSKLGRRSDDAICQQGSQHGHRSILRVANPTPATPPGHPIPTIWRADPQDVRGSFKKFEDRTGSRSIERGFETKPPLRGVRTPPFGEPRTSRQNGPPSESPRNAPRRRRGFRTSGCGDRPKKASIESS